MSDVPDAELEALAWFRQVADVRGEMRFYEAWDHAAAIVRAALARDVPAPGDEPSEMAEIRRTLQDAIDERDGAWAGRVKATGEELHELRGAADLAESILRALPDVSDRAGTAATDEPPAVETVTEWRVTADIPSGGEAAEEFLFERDAVWQAVRWHECGWFNVRLFSRSVEITRRESEWELVQRGNGDEGSAS